jgi:hypothetical protein
MRFVLLALVSILCLTNSVPATVYHVNPEGTGDFPTIQEGIDACAVGDTVLCAAGVFEGDGNCDLSFGGVDLVLRGEGPDLTILDCAYPRPGLSFTDGETQNARVEALTIWRAHHVWDGGGIRCLNGSSPSLTDLIVRDCTAWQSTTPSPADGGGLYAWNSSPRLERIRFEGNVGLSAVCYEGDSDPTLIDVFIGKSDTHGPSWGGLALIGDCHPQIESLVLDGY